MYLVLMLWLGMALAVAPVTASIYAEDGKHPGFGFIDGVVFAPFYVLMGFIVVIRGE